MKISQRKQWDLICPGKVLKYIFFFFTHSLNNKALACFVVKLCKTSKMTAHLLVLLWAAFFEEALLSRASAMFDFHWHDERSSGVVTKWACSTCSSSLKKKKVVQNVEVWITLSFMDAALHHTSVAEWCCELRLIYASNKRNGSSAYAYYLALTSVFQTMQSGCCLKVANLRPAWLPSQRWRN